MAFLTRQALEDGVAQLSAYRDVAAADASFGHQLICLPYYLDDDPDGDLARRTSHCWHALSTACHAHPYQLNPTAGELRGWIDDVDAFLTQVATAVAV